MAMPYAIGFTLARRGLATVFLTGFMPIFWKIPGCRCGGRPFVLATMSPRRAALPGFSDDNLARRFADR